VNPLLFGGATARKRHADGTNSWGNDFDATRYLSNYAELPVPVEYGGVQFPSTEQAYVAAKFNDPALSQFIAGLSSGVDKYGNVTQPAQVARNLGRSKSGYQWSQAGWQGPAPVLRGDWNDMKVGVMENLVRQKFQKNPEFRDFLVGTGDRELIEHTTGWGSRWEGNKRVHIGDPIWGMVDPVVIESINNSPWGQGLSSKDAQAERLVGENHLGRTLMMVRGELGGSGLVGRHAPPPAVQVPAVMPEQPAAAANPTGQQTADAVQLDLWEKGQRFAGDAWPYLAAAGGAGLVGYAVADLMGRGSGGEEFGVMGQ
jgi:predicted NAD-dependent protein-ADP-ribosyltransferase YbiA (DUF1768 family)